MPDMLSNAVAGLQVFQRALSTTSHNIANVNTDGYSRQTTDISTRLPSIQGGVFYGNSVEVNAVTRHYDQFLTAEQRLAQSSFSRLETYTDLSSQIDDVLADPLGGISPVLQDFFSAAQDVADDPTSSTARLQLLNQSDALTQRFAFLDSRFRDLADNTGTRITEVVNEINDLVSSIKDVNLRLGDSGAFGNGSSQSADLLDQRDQYLDELSKRINISVIDEGRGQMSIFVGNGQTILNGVTQFTLSPATNPANPDEDFIIYNGLNQVNDLSQHLDGGELGGLLQFRREVLNPGRNSLGRVALAVAETVNIQHNRGMDLYNNQGQDFFSYSAPEAYPYSTNAGAASVTSSISDVSQLTEENYTLSYDGANWSMTSFSGGSTVTVADGGGAGTLVSLDGIDINIAAGHTLGAGDAFTIRPYLNAAKNLQTLISDPNRIAAAAPIRANANLQNLGNGEISDGTVTDSSNPNLTNTVNLTFSSATTFTSPVDVVVNGTTTITAGNPITYIENMSVEANGWLVTLNGTPQSGDVFTIDANSNGVGDNRNMLAFANLQNTRILDNQASSFQEAYSSFIGRIGAQVQSAESTKDAQGSLLGQISDRKAQISGVNLDEEAADLVKFQQAYEATARIISTSQTLFETLISVTR